jgi:hypothetical protein
MGKQGRDEEGESGNGEELGGNEGDANGECASEEEVEGWSRQFRGNCVYFHPCDES